ncbi:exonuclease domain-containing protein [Desulfobacterales bacterium HSG16]|nr:exonuclease domain-containing protein [Desulfobacterales bacterium HSG16]
MNSYLFYDIETTGFNKAYDQVVQFAAIRTDTRFNEIERHNILVKLRPDVVISPQAMITHRIPIAKLGSGMSEYESIFRIHRMMNAPGTISLGYNSLGFDDEFLRFSFYRNLFKPYTHQYNKGCFRMDLLPMAAVFRVFKPDVLKWPEAGGRPSLKLELINAANNLVKGRSHDALVDVEVCVALAKVFYREKKMWDYLTESFDKRIDQDRIFQLPHSFDSIFGPHSKALIVDSMFGPDDSYQAVGLSIGNSEAYKNQSLYLRVDLPELIETRQDSIDNTTRIIRRKYGEPRFILPPKPRFYNRISARRRETVKNNIDFLLKNPIVFHEIIKYHRQYKYPFIPNLDIDAALYQNGFPSHRDTKTCERFNNADLPEKIEMISLFKNPGYKNLARRVLWRNYSDRLDAELMDDLHRHMKKVNPDSLDKAMLDYMGKPRFTPEEAISVIKRIKEEDEPDSEQITLLDELDEYLHDHFIL